MKLNQKGFGAVGIIVVVLVLATLAFLGWFVLRKNHTAATTPSPIAKNAAPLTSESKNQKYSPVIPDGWQIYKNDSLGFSFAYPKQWGEMVDEAYPGGAYDARDDWIMHKKTPKVSGSSVKGMSGSLSLDVNTKNYQEFRIAKAGTPLIYNYRDGKEFWTASGTVDSEYDDYKPGDVYDVPVEKTINSTNVYKLYSDYEGIVSGGWRFAVKDGIVTIYIPSLEESNMMTGEITGDTDSYKSLLTKVLNSINIY
jgi:hypothetical protein